MHDESVVCLVAHRERRRAGLLPLVRRQEERLVDGQSLAYERIAADRPELSRLRACREGVKLALEQLGEGFGELVKLDVAVPVELMVAQSELAGVARCLLELLGDDLVENRGHRAIVTTLRGDDDA